jgi:hypothetical protein
MNNQLELVIFLFYFDDCLDENNVVFRFIVGVLHPRQAIEMLLNKPKAF